MPEHLTRKFEHRPASTDRPFAREFREILQRIMNRRMPVWPELPVSLPKAGVWRGFGPGLVVP